MTRLLAAVAVSITLDLSVALGQESKSELPLEVIKRVWSQRQADTRSVRVIIAGRKTIPGLERRIAIRREMRRGNSTLAQQNKTPAPPTTITETVTFNLDGNRASYIVSSQFPKDLPLLPYVKGTYNGHETVRYSTDTQGIGVAALTSRNGPQEPEPPESVSICFLLFRPLESSFRGLNLSACRVLPDRIKTDDASLIILEMPDPKCPVQYWIDPARAYSIVREVDKFNTSSRRIDITYSYSTEHGWLPNGWRCVTVKDRGGLIESLEATVSEITVNQSIAESEFAIEIPNGTYSYDTRDGKRNEGWIGTPPRTYGWSDRLFRVVAFNVIIIVLVIGVLSWKWFRSYYKRGRLP